VDAQEAAQLLQSESINEELIESAAETASGTEINPFGNIHASVEYQRHLAKVLTKKALKIAIERAAEER
jgi:CO/xanthine dehydrogenase FAD-binding subunit